MQETASRAPRAEDEQTGDDMDWYESIPDSMGQDDRRAVAIWIGHRTEQLMRERRSAVIKDVRGRKVLIDGTRLDHAAACCGYRIYGFLFDNGRVKAMRIDEITEYDGVPARRMRAKA